MYISFGPSQAAISRETVDGLLNRLQPDTKKVVGYTVLNFAERFDKHPGRQFAVCINNSDYPASLELHKIYRVLPDDDAAKDGDLRSLMKAARITCIQPSILF